MTYSESTDESTGVTVVGGCPYNSHKANLQEQYVKLPQNISHLNEFMCGGLDRNLGYCVDAARRARGLLCSPIHYIVYHVYREFWWVVAVYIPCSLPHNNILLIVTIFQIRVTSVPMNAFISICQVITNVVNSQPYTIMTMSPFIHIMTIIFTTFCGFWNLDIFRYAIPSFCVSDQLTPIQVISLEYVVAFYPLLLITATYIIMC